MSKVAKNIIYNFFGQGLLFILGLVSARYIFKQLGEEVLGIIYFMTPVTALLSAVSIGALTVSVREISSHFKKEPEYVIKFIRTGALFFWSSYLLSSVAFFFAVPIIAQKWINLTLMSEAVAITSLRILGFGFFLALPRSFYASLFQGLEQMEFNNAIDIATYALQQAGIILIIISGGGLLNIVYWYVACFTVSVLAYIVFSAKFFSTQILLPKYSHSVFKRNFSFAAKMMFNSTTGAAHMQADKVAISKLLPVGILGYYSFAYGIVAKAGLFTGAVGQSALPSFSFLHSSGQREALLRQYWKLQDALCLVTAAFFAFIIYVSVPLFSHIFNEQVARMLLMPTALLCLGFYMNATMVMPYYFSIATSHPGITMRFHTLGLFTVLPLTVALVYFFGLIGAGLSLVSFYLLCYLYSLPRICSQCLKFPVRLWVKHTGKVYLLLFLTYGLAWLVLWLKRPYSIANIFWAYPLASFAFMLGAWKIMRKELKESVAHYLLRVKNVTKDFLLSSTPRAVKNIVPMQFKVWFSRKFKETRVYIDIVGSCNLCCPSCFRGQIDKGPRGIMELELFKKIIQKLSAEYPQSIICLFNWTEPFLHPQLPEFIRIVRNFGLGSSLSTNLNIAGNFDEVLLAKPSNFKISLSGFTQEIYEIGHRGGNIERVKANMKALSESIKRLNSHLKICVHYHKYNYNLHELEPMKQYAYSLGFEFVSTWAFHMPAESALTYLRGGASLEESKFIETRYALKLDEAIAATVPYRNISCSLPDYLAIDFKGNVALCCAVSERTLIGPFLSLSPKEIKERKGRHRFCKECTKSGLHVYYTYHDHEKLRSVYDRIAEEGASLIGIRK